MAEVHTHLEWAHSLVTKTESEERQKGKQRDTVGEMNAETGNQKERENLRNWAVEREGESDGHGHRVGSRYRDIKT